MPQPQPTSNGLALVTGATGFVGAALVRALRRDGTPVRILARSKPDLAALGEGVEVATGDLRDRAAVAEAVRGAARVFHCAADYRLWAPDPDEIIRSNVDGTRNIMEEAMRAGVGRIVYTSSVATLRLENGRASDETEPLDPEAAIGTYKRSKVLAERVVERLVREEGLPAVIVNPSTPIGPGDVKPTPTGRIIVEAASGRMPAFVDTGLNLAHVDDVAEGHLLAMANGRVGERYILGGENVTLSQMLAAIARIVGRRPPTVRLPLQAIYPLAFVCDMVAQVTKRPPFVTRDALRMARKHMFFTDSKARAELGYRSRPYTEGLSDAIDWFRRAGHIR